MSWKGAVPSSLFECSVSTAHAIEIKCMALKKIHHIDAQTNHGTQERRCTLMHSSWCWVSGTRWASSHRGSPPQSRAIWMHFIFFQLARCCQDFGGKCQLQRKPCHSSGRCRGVGGVATGWVIWVILARTCGSAIIQIKRFHDTLSKSKPYHAYEVSCFCHFFFVLLESPDFCIAQYVSA